MSAPGRPRRDSLARSDKAGLMHAPVCSGRTVLPHGNEARAPIAVGTEWTVPLLERFDVALAAHARRLQLDT